MRLLIIIVAIQQLLDIASTWYALRTGIGREANGWLARVMNHFGVLPALLLTKMTLLAVCWWLRPPWQAYAVLAAMYTAVLINNARAIHQGRQNRP
ncbi:hypothetical protein CFN79_18895 [Chromobacterium vaccinii]|uniref:DUF5658 family protein n=1 Tax=Chromobacterium vaccinii TaxID=1108595 RepID=UPI000CE9641B|nr:DUF5658 family protein [Chromobacterium vaccinii]AVG17014.1 hypothetical protein CFN79_14780 [Chromobacterium vaccinii]AVG17766.1 hypothetical protein CFN79_18895 [Chromobacterium vaccinii]